MHSRFSYLETAAEKKRVLYTGTNVIYEGMPVCYEYDSTTNIDGYDATDGAGTTTDEGHQNEGKYNRVTDPANNNIMHFAGVIAGSNEAGVTGTGSIWLDIYVANGAVVPVRCDVDTVTGVTLLAITVDSQEFGQPVEGTSRVVALAMETETVLDSAGADITLARLDRNLTSYQDLDGTPLSIGAGTGDYVVNSINVTSAQTTGRICALHIKCTVTAGGGSDHYGLTFHAEGIISGTPDVHVVGASARLTITGGTPDGKYYTGFKAYLKQTAGTMTDAALASVLNLGLQVTGTFTDPALCWMYLEDNSTQHCHNFIRTKYMTDLPAIVMTGDRTIGSTKGDYAIKVYVQAHAGIQQWYIPLMKGVGA